MEQFQISDSEDHATTIYVSNQQLTPQLNGHSPQMANGHSPRVQRSAFRKYQNGDLNALAEVEEKKVILRDPRLFRSFIFRIF